MSLKQIYLSSPHMGGKEKLYVQEAFDTNWVAPLGPNVTGFESDLETYLGEGCLVAALSSGTAALHLALILLGVEQGDEVICQSMTFSASANPIVYQGATPVFIDSEPESWNMSPEHLEVAIKDRIAKGKKPKAIIAVHLYGMPYMVDELRSISKAYDIPIIEDAAEALGSTYKGQNCGSFGNLAILSFNGNKIITTSGGGALVSKDPEHIDRAIFLATQARDEAPHYQHSEIGYNYRLSNICAGIGRGQMEVLNERVKLRRSMHAFYSELFQDKNGIKVFSEPSRDHFSNHWLTCITVDPGITGFTSEEIRLALNEKQIESRPLWKPMHLQPVFESAPYYGGNIAKDLFQRGLCLPSGSNLDSVEKERIMTALSQFL
ncbi:aminotransferase class I/II-fold pyridoxal phosphate-dependent enzyme [Aureitalea sp. L0-47]|uniref:DegT/DnrJ/EryC1/StrS family aminotransferase n=1 Tax=Aureitalea sp. L0-47 TaxID=2816962 RepID=UPI002237E215|nr:aminotransferase class I/II-fold pyridoxal phosphate-dependent enzyme [Aureitalea sp. L0-47]MCW5520386.1 aminotransferase class I/II-fold pyridoxal phosphate-dependent enzyme [Aureitalea sp. L0-47]